MLRRRRFRINDALIPAALVMVVALLGTVTACGTSTSSSKPSASATAAVSTSYKASAVLLGTNVPAVEDWNTDQLRFDPTSGRLYLADASNWAVDVWDIGSSQFIAQIAGFAGPSGAAFFNFDKVGPNGLALDDQGRLWVGDGDGSVKIIDTKTLAITSTIATGAKFKVDAIAIDAADGLVMVTCPAENTPTSKMDEYGNPILEYHPMVAFFDSKTLKVVGTTQLTGIEATGQAVYGADTAKFYVPVTSTSGTGGVAVIDPKTRQVTSTIDLGKCEPSGAAFGPGTQLLVGTATVGFNGQEAAATGQPAIIDVAKGTILARLPAPSKAGRGIDGVAYDGGAKQYFLADMSSASIWVYDAVTFKELSEIAVGDAHQLAVDTANHHLFVPVNLKGLAVYIPTGQ
jgi:DNA-binding beta-propeller fold protein YncE